MIRLTNLQKIYRTKEIETVALDQVNIEVKAGEFLSVMGPSGCGKSTLLNIMGLLDAPTAGEVEIGGIPCREMNDTAQAGLRNRQLGFVFQSFHLIHSLNVLDNVALPLLYRKSVVIRSWEEGDDYVQPESYWRSTFRFWSNVAPDFGRILLVYGLLFFALLAVPAVSLSGMTGSRIERRLSEMGVRRAFGATRGMLMRQILGENFVFTLLGGVLGLALSCLLVYAGRSRSVAQALFPDGDYRREVNRK